MKMVAVRYYPSDLTDSQWQLIAPFFRRPSHRGAPRKYDRRTVVNAIFYLIRSGCQWRMLPRDFPHWKTVYQLFYRWRKSGLWHRIHETLRGRVRQQEGKSTEPTAAVIDSQSVKTTHIGGSDRGYDAGKKVKGRKRHVVVDMLGLLLSVSVHSAQEQDYEGAPLVLIKLWEAMKQIRVIFGDTVYGYRKLPEFIKATLGYDLEIVKRPAHQSPHQFSVQQKRWIVERTFAWLSLFRRNSKDYEVNPQTSEAVLEISMVQIMLNRLKKTR